MRCDQRGFTLIEVLLAVLIGSLLLTAIYGVFGSVSSAKQQLEQEGEAYHQVRIFFDRIGGELSSLRLAPAGKQPTLTSAKTFEGESAVEFNTELGSPFLQQKGGLSRVRYELRREEQGATLYRSEQVLLADLAPSEALPFVEGLKGFQIRYFRQGTWQEKWTGNRLPELLEITLELEVAGRIIPFRSSFVLPEGRG